MGRISLKISRDDKLRRRIAKNGRETYIQNFNSTIVADYIISNTFGFKNSEKKFMWAGK